ncbi:MULTISPECIES: hypothetical protein [Spirulina sp. CCY15215]|uniref:hypothetical protein n=1 Tax=Spirulina sp. CCY15215 TaxID=2767591 RepID=UPI00194E38C8|nr:hypothetical protein [Spirulina major]
MTNSESVLLEKLRRLPPEQIEVVEQFIDELLVQREKRFLVRSAMTLSENSLAKIWDNSEDAEYDNL